MSQPQIETATDLSSKLPDEIVNDTDSPTDVRDSVLKSASAYQTMGNKVAYGLISQGYRWAQLAKLDPRHNDALKTHVRGRLGNTAKTYEIWAKDDGDFHPLFRSLLDMDDNSTTVRAINLGDATRWCVFQSLNPSQVPTALKSNGGYIACGQKWKQEKSRRAALLKSKKSSDSADDDTDENGSDGTDATDLTDTDLNDGGNTDTWRLDDVGDTTTLISPSPLSSGFAWDPSSLEVSTSDGAIFLNRSLEENGSKNKSVIYPALNHPTFAATIEEEAHLADAACQGPAALLALVIQFGTDLVATAGKLNVQLQTDDGSTAVSVTNAGRSNGRAHSIHCNVRGVLSGFEIQ